MNREQVKERVQDFLPLTASSAQVEQTTEFVWGCVEDALFDYQNPVEGKKEPPNPAEGNFVPGTLRIATEHKGFVDISCFYTTWRGVKLAVHREAGGIAGVQDWRVTEPVTGLAIPGVRGRTGNEVWQNFVEAVPSIEARMKGKTLDEYLRGVVANPANELRNAREAFDRKNS